MDFYRLFDILEYQKSRFERKDAICDRGTTGIWQAYSTRFLMEERNRLSAGLLQIGMHPGQKVALLAHAGSARWVIADLALQQIGLIPVPIHSTARPDEIRHILSDASVVAAFVSNEAMAEKVRASGISLQYLIGLEPITDTISWDEAVCEPDQSDLDKIAYYKAMIQPGSLATLLYTSGTTGQPKGVMLSHENIVSNIKSVLAVVPVNQSMTVVSFLPLSHIFERMVCYLYLSAGSGIYFAPSVETLPQTLQEVRPHFFTAVPRILERSYERLLEMRASAGPLKKRLMSWAMALGERYPYAGQAGMPLVYRLQLWWADFLVFRHWRKAMGGRVKGIVVGAAALSPKLGRLFSAAGVDVREGYGLTETSPVVAFNRFEPGGVRFGTVGIPAPGVEVRIGPPNEQGEGEIEVKGPNVMLGYFGLPDATHERFTTDGWFKTGDLGKFEHKRFLRITGRISEIFKTSSGKFVAPAFVEQQLRSSPFIDQALVAGLNQPHAGALILPNFVFLEQWCQSEQIHWTAPAYMILNPKVEKKIREEIENVNQQWLGPAEQVRCFTLVADAWTAENGLLTPSLKLRRNALTEKYQTLLQELFTK